MVEKILLTQYKICVDCLICSRNMKRKILHCIIRTVKNIWLVGECIILTMKKIKSFTTSRKALKCYAIFAMWMTCFFIYYSRYYGECSKVESDEIIRELCELYRSGVILGDLCHALCTTKDLLHTGCLHARGHHKHVYTAKYHGQNVVIKLKSFHEWDTLPINTRANFTETMKHYARDFLGVTMDTTKKFNDFIRITWGDDIDWTSDTLNVTLMNVKYLLQQQEYVFQKYYSHLSFMSDVIGTCGYVYVIESAPSLIDWQVPFMPSYLFSTWHTRATTALKFLDMIREMSSLPTPLHNCDLLLRNFGLNSAGQLIAIDTDSIWLKTLTQYNPYTCEVGNACNLMECLGLCEVPECIPDPTNTTKECKTDPQCVITPHSNLQTFCHHIFLIEGMYYGAPASIYQELLETAEACVDLLHTASKSTAPGQQSPEQLMRRLYTLLRKGIQ